MSVHHISGKAQLDALLRLVFMIDSCETMLLICTRKTRLCAHSVRNVRPSQLVVLDFGAAWCGPCRMIKPFFAQMAKKYPEVTNTFSILDNVILRKLNTNADNLC